jgi:hypothetical protein
MDQVNGEASLVQALFVASRKRKDTLAEGTTPYITVSTYGFTAAVLGQCGPLLLRY